MPFVMRSPWFWFYIPGTVMLCLVPDIIYEVYVGVVKKLADIF